MDELLKTYKHMIYREFEFDAAHRLTFHEGKCRNLHGHRWRLQVWISGNLRNNMVMDYGDLKILVKANIIDLLDHSLLKYDKDPILNELFSVSNIAKYEFKVNTFPFETTAENLAEWMYNKIELALPDGVKMHAIKLWETPLSCEVYQK